MNWYKIAKTYYNEEDMERHINALVSKEMQNRDITPFEKLELTEKLQNILSQYPSGYRLRKTSKGWSVMDENGDFVCINEPDLEHAIPGGKSRFDYMGTTIN